eukprot:919265-Rhodomonas_salina.2
MAYGRAPALVCASTACAHAWLCVHAAELLQGSILWFLPLPPSLPPSLCPLSPALSTSAPPLPSLSLSLTHSLTHSLSRFGAHTPGPETFCSRQPRPRPRLPDRGSSCGPLAQDTCPAHGKDL